MRLSGKTMDARRGRIRVSAQVTNTGSRAGDEVAQLYVNDPVASISQPVRRLRGFERVTLQPGQTKTVSWTLDRDDVGFYDNRGRFVVENGRINVFVGNTSSQSDNKQTFTRHRRPAGEGQPARALNSRVQTGGGRSPPSSRMIPAAECARPAWWPRSCTMVQQKSIAPARPRQEIRVLTRITQ